MSRFALILFSNSLKILAGLRGTTAKLTNRKQHQEDERHIEDLLSEESFLLCCPSSYDECLLSLVHTQSLEMNPKVQVQTRETCYFLSVLQKLPTAEAYLDRPDKCRVENRLFPSDIAVAEFGNGK